MQNPKSEQKSIDFEDAKNQVEQALGRSIADILENKTSTDELIATNAHKILGVSLIDLITKSEYDLNKLIQAAYYKLAKVLHPDKNPNQPEASKLLFSIVADAANKLKNEELKNEKLRNAYINKHMPLNEQAIHRSSAFKDQTSKFKDTATGRLDEEKLNAYLDNTDFGELHISKNGFELGSILGTDEKKEVSTEANDPRPGTEAQVYRLLKGWQEIPKDKKDDAHVESMPGIILLEIPYERINKDGIKENMVKILTCLPAEELAKYIEKIFKELIPRLAEGEIATKSNSPVLVFRALGEKTPTSDHKKASPV